MMIAFIFRLACTCVFIFDEVYCLPIQGMEPRQRLGFYSSRPKPPGSASVTDYGSTKGGFSGSSWSSNPIVSQPSEMHMPLRQPDQYVSSRWQAAPEAPRMPAQEEQGQSQSVSQLVEVQAPVTQAPAPVPQTEAKPYRYPVQLSQQMPPNQENWVLMQPALANQYMSPYSMLAPEGPSQQSVSNEVEVQTPVQLTQVSKGQTQAPQSQAPPEVPLMAVQEEQGQSQSVSQFVEVQAPVTQAPAPVPQTEVKPVQYMAQHPSGSAPVSFLHHFSPIQPVPYGPWGHGYPEMQSAPVQIPVKLIQAPVQKKPVQAPVQVIVKQENQAPQQAPVPVQPPVKRVQTPAKVPQQKPVQSPVQVIWEEAKAPQQAPVPVQPPVKRVQAPAKVPQQKPVQVVKEETQTPQQAPVPVQPSVELIQAPVQMPPTTEMYMPPSWTNLWMPAPANPYIYLQSPATPERVWMMPAPEEPSQQSVSKVEVQTPVQVIEEETKTPQQAPVHVQAPVKQVQTPAKVPQQKPVQSPVQVIKEETQAPQQAPVPVQSPVKRVQAQEEPVQVNVEEAEAPVETSSNIAGGSSEPERYIVITSPSGFQTRYIVKSFNRYARGKHVYSQTTYIPLDLVKPVPVPSVPVKDSQTGKA